MAGHAVTPIPDTEAALRRSGAGMSALGRSDAMSPGSLNASTTSAIPPSGSRPWSWFAALRLLRARSHQSTFESHEGRPAVGGSVIPAPAYAGWGRGWRSRRRGEWRWKWLSVEFTRKITRWSQLRPGPWRRAYRLPADPRSGASRTPYPSPLGTTRSSWVTALPSMPWTSPTMPTGSRSALWVGRPCHLGRRSGLFPSR